MIDMRTLFFFVRVSKFVTMTISSIDISISQITNQYNNKTKIKYTPFPVGIVILTVYRIRSVYFTE